ncbi:MAG: DMT family transporter [Actinobacteria bacterium]|nr:DMT family transporter [Actinomycetota bacterium]
MSASGWNCVPTTPGAKRKPSSPGPLSTSPPGRLSTDHSSPPSSRSLRSSRPSACQRRCSQTNKRSWKGANTDERRPAGPLFDATFAGAVVAAGGGLAAGDLVLPPAWPAHGWLVLLALTAQVLAWLLLSVSLPRLPAVVTSLLLLLQPVGAVLLGAVLLGEAPSPAQLAGVVVVVAGIAWATLPVD